LKGPSRPELPAALTITTPLLMAFFITGLNTLCRHTNTCGGGNVSSSSSGSGGGSHGSSRLSKKYRVCTQQYSVACALMEGATLH
jgi:hypothetical protein